MDETLPREVEGVVRYEPLYGPIIVTNPSSDSGWGAKELFDGLEGKRVKVRIEILDVAHKAD